jgi:3-hydroxyacyl-CoA dehydrogenase
VLGAGVLGAQISFQIAYRGFEVTTYDVSEAALKQARQRFEGIAAVYPTEVEGATAAAAQETIERIRFTTQLASAVQGADLVIEAVPESLELKRDVFARIATLAPPTAVFVTNSSTLLPSELMDSTGRPDRFLALHFANHIWVNNMAEVMSSPNTDPRVYQRVVAFAKEIGMVPIELHKEQRGYIVNSLLGPLLMAAADLLLRGVAEPKTIGLRALHLNRQKAPGQGIAAVEPLVTREDASRMRVPDSAASARNEKMSQLYRQFCFNGHPAHKVRGAGPGAVPLECGILITAADVLSAEGWRTRS